MEGKGCFLHAVASGHAGVAMQHLVRDRGDVQIHRFGHMAVLCRAIVAVKLDVFVDVDSGGV